MPRYAALTGWGLHVPEKVLTNQDLESLVDTSDEWIRTRTGIVERRVAGPNDSVAGMATAAARQALARARTSPEELDLIISATTAPDQLLPATSCIVQHDLGATKAGVFDLNSACTGFLSAVVVGTQFIQAGTFARVLVVAGEMLTRFVNWKDRNTCVLFGDGAGAVVLEATDQECGVLSTVMGCQGDVAMMLSIEGGCAAKPASAETLAAGDHFIRMRGPDVFKQAVRSMASASKKALAKLGLTGRDVRMVIPHQANGRILSATRDALHLPEEKVFVNLDRYGNTGAASLPIALCEYLESGPVAPGDNLLFVAFGGGLTWASAVVRWADVGAIVGDRPQIVS
jgi:3-oxoacyl-[acyl-carrier-protein] synthase III